MAVPLTASMAGVPDVMLCLSSLAVTGLMDSAICFGDVNRRVGSRCLRGMEQVRAQCCCWSKLSVLQITCNMYEPVVALADASPAECKSAAGVVGGVSCACSCGFTGHCYVHGKNRRVGWRSLSQACSR
jgi:hypothetical protein